MSEYVNPIDNVIKDLEYKRTCIIKAYNSGHFCDNKTSKHNIEVLTKGITPIKKERTLYTLGNSNKQNDYKYLVEMYYLADNSSEPIVVCDTKEKAQDYIDNEMKGYQYNGTGYYRIRKIKYHE